MLEQEMQETGERTSQLHIEINEAASEQGKDRRRKEEDGFFGCRKQNFVWSESQTSVKGP